MKPFRIDSKGEVSKGEANRYQELQIKHIVGVVPSSSHQGPKIKFACGKSATQAAEVEHTIEGEKVAEEELEPELEEQPKEEDEAKSKELEESKKDEKLEEDQEEEEGNEEEERHDEEMQLSP